MKVNIIALFIVVVCSVYQANAQQEIGKIKSFKRQGKSVVFNCENKQKVKLSIVGEDIIRLQLAVNGKFEKSKMIEYGYIKDNFQAVNFGLKEESGKIHISTSLLNIYVEKKMFRINITDTKGNHVLSSSKQDGIRVGEKNILNFTMPADEHYFGFGFMRKTLDARGQKLTFKREYRWEEATLPFFMSTRGYAFYSNSVFNQDFDFTSKTDTPGGDYYSVTSKGGTIDFYIIYGPDFPKLLDRYTDLTGKCNLIPRWAFGLEYRLRYYGDQEELLSVAKEFRNKEIPADIMALEPGWEEVPYSMQWKWSSERFPEPKKMIKELGEMGFKLDLWESGVAPTKNITDEKTRLDWYAKRKNIVDMGVRMFKQDDPYPRSIISSELLDPVLSDKKLTDKKLTGEELNNVANTLYTETLFNEFRKQTNQRAVVMFHAYNASVASHRWPFQWAGDFQAENGMLNASLSGHAMVSYDIRNPYAAGWHQGFFTPFSVVDAWAYYREPWLYSESIEQSHRIYACLRSRLVPYFYSSLWQSHLSGLPIERPMVLNYHNDPVTYQMKSQFMVGDWFLLALSDVDDSPAGEKIDFWTGSQKGNHGRIYLPKGKWINYWNGDVEDIEENKWVYGDWPEYLGGLLYVKAGAIIPMGQVKNYIGETKDEVIVLDVYPYKESSYQLYEDDGITYEYEEGKYALTDILCSQKSNQVNITISERKGSYSNMPEKRTFLVKVHSQFKPKTITVDGAELSYFADSDKLIYSETGKGWYYDAQSKKAILKLDDGWQYVSNERGLDPLSTIPLTAKNERVEWFSNSKTENVERNIVLNMPEKAIAELSSNIKTLPADGLSIASVSLSFKNPSTDIGEVMLGLNGVASFANGQKQMVLNTDDERSFLIKAGTIPGVAKVTITGPKIENGFFELPVYGKPARLELSTNRNLLSADNKNAVKISAHLYDKNGSMVLNAHSPIIVDINGEARCDNGLKTDSMKIVNGVATTLVHATFTPGQIHISTKFRDLKGENLTIVSAKGEMQVRINPPEKVKLDSDGGWIPNKVDVFVNFKANGKLLESIEKEVVLNVYNKQNELIDTYIQSAKKGEVIFKDVTYYKRPAQCLFEIVCDGYETVTRKVFANTWDTEASTKGKQKAKH